jgi:hypothetical protein
MAHFWRSGESTKALYAAIQKYGKAAFVIEIIASATNQSELDAAEIQWIETLGTLSPRGYNLRAGGEGGGRHSDQSVQQLIAMRGTPEYRERQSLSQKTVQARPEVKAKQRAGLIEAWSRPGEQIRRSKINKASQLRPEVREKKRAVALIVQNDPAVKAKKAEAYRRPKVLAKLGQTREKVWINNGQNNRRINRLEQLPSGWERGRINFKNERAGLSTAGTRWVTDGTINRRVRTIPDGWMLGRSGVAA